ncbi:MAG: hypothetical protein ACK4E8_00220 [Lacibacter sp.]|jgi:hypothetical protein
MQKIRMPVLLVTLFAFAYQATPWLGVSDNLIFALFLFSPVAVIWMVYRVLRDGTPSPYTWEERFYEDHPYERRGREAQLPES